MKLRQEHVKRLKKELQELHQEIPNTIREIDNWLRVQEEREYGSVDSEWATHVRNELEKRLTKFRARLGDIYDHMSERGMRQIETSKPR